MMQLNVNTARLTVLKGRNVAAPVIDHTVASLFCQVGEREVS